MATLNNGMPIAGSLGELSVYKTKGATNLAGHKKDGGSK